jgi:acyl-CoA thioester hydrolase
MHTPLADYPVVIEIPVAWGEMDAYGHVNNIVYFRYFETARIVYFGKLESPDFVNRNPLGPILASTSCRFRAPLAFPDHLQVRLDTVNTIPEMSNSHSTMALNC